MGTQKIIALTKWDIRCSLIDRELCSLIENFLSRISMAFSTIPLFIPHPCLVPADSLIWLSVSTPKCRVSVTLGTHTICHISLPVSFTHMRVLYWDEEARKLALLSLMFIMNF